jgi:ABC-type sulfate transport system substrate-binding protein
MRKKIYILIFGLLFSLNFASAQNINNTINKSVVLGDELKLVCNNLNDIAIVQWYKDGVILDKETGDKLIIKSAKLSDAGTYYAIVDGVCGVTQTNNVIVNIEIPHSPGIEIAVAGGDYLFQNEPNPAGDLINFKFSLSNSTFARLVLYDVYANEVAVIFEGIANSGLNSYSFNASSQNLANGTYFYTLITNNFKESKSLILIR